MHQLTNSNRLQQEKGKYLFQATDIIEPVIERGEGSFVWDLDGNCYLDVNSGQFCVCLGHRNERFLHKIQQQMERLVNTNTATVSPEVYEAAEKMAEINQYHLSKTIFLSTGSEANECALRYAKYITGKQGVFSMSQGYHGLTLASQSATMSGKWARPMAELSIAIETPDYYHSNQEISKEDQIKLSILDLRKQFERYGNVVAAFILEPVIGVGGMIEISESFLQEARRLCNEYDVLLIFDECQCGFGRTGEWFYYQRSGVVPDMLVTAKAMGMGLPVSAVTFREETAKRIEGKLTHFSSHQNDPIAATTVAFVIDEIREQNFLESNKVKGKCLLKALEEVCRETKYLVRPRGYGLMCAVDIPDELWEQDKQIGTQFIQFMQQNGVLIQAVRQGRTFRIMPNYYITYEEIDLLKEALKKSALTLEEVCACKQ